MKEQRIEMLAESWLKLSMSNETSLVGLYLIFRSEPDTAWQTILRITELRPTAEQFALLAAGPLEDLLSTHGPYIIGQIEDEAATNPVFNELLGGVSRFKMTDDVWDRVQAARKMAW